MNENNIIRRSFECTNMNVFLMFQAFVVFILATIARDVISNPVIAVGEAGASAQFRSEDVRI